jgi:hypothetical protein
MESGRPMTTHEHLPGPGVALDADDAMAVLDEGLESDVRGRRSSEDACYSIT